MGLPASEMQSASSPRADRDERRDEQLFSISGGSGFVDGSCSAGQVLQRQMRAMRAVCRQKAMEHTLEMMETAGRDDAVDAKRRM